MEEATHKASISEIKALEHKAEYYCKQGDYKEAIPFYKKSIELRGMIAPDDEQSLAKSYYHLGESLYMQSEYKEALEMAQIGLNICLRTRTDPIYIAISYGLLGDIYRYLGDDTKSLEYLHKSLTMFTDSDNENTFHAAKVKTVIGEVYFHQKLYQKALSIFQEALTILVFCLGHNNTHVAQLYNSIAVTWMEIDDKKVLENYKKCLEIHKTLGKESLAVASTYANLANWYNNKLNHQKSIEYANKAIKIYSSKGLTHHPGLIQCYKQLGYNYFKLSQEAKGMLNFQRALKTQMKDPESDLEQLDFLFTDLAELVSDIQPNMALDFVKSRLFYLKNFSNGSVENLTEAKRCIKTLESQIATKRDFGLDSLV